MRWKGGGGRQEEAYHATSQRNLKSEREKTRAHAHTQKHLPHGLYAGEEAHDSEGPEAAEDAAERERERREGEGEERGKEGEP